MAEQNTLLAPSVSLHIEVPEAPNIHTPLHPLANNQNNVQIPYHTLICKPGTGN